jgi:hypothetical protein
MRATSVAAAIANSRGCQLAATDGTLQVAHAGVEEEELQGSISCKS